MIVNEYMIPKCLPELNTFVKFVKFVEFVAFVAFVVFVAAVDSIKTCLHTGHVSCFFVHVIKQFVWKWWLHEVVHWLISTQMVV